jgi:hypothetical protein
MSTRKTATILALGWMAWGAIVDANGLPVFDQVLFASVLTVIALMMHGDGEV